MQGVCGTVCTKAAHGATRPALQAVEEHSMRCNWHNSYTVCLTKSLWGCSVCVFVDSSMCVCCMYYICLTMFVPNKQWALLPAFSSGYSRQQSLYQHPAVDIKQASSPWTMTRSTANALTARTNCFINSPVLKYSFCWHSWTKLEILACRNICCSSIFYTWHTGMPLTLVW